MWRFRAGAGHATARHSDAAVELRRWPNELQGTQRLGSSGSAKTLTLAAPRQTLSNDFLSYLRYVSWKVTAFSGATSALIWIRGTARR